MLARESWQTVENSWKKNTIFNEHPVDYDKKYHYCQIVVIGGGIRGGEVFPLSLDEGMSAKTMPKFLSLEFCDEFRALQ